MSRKFANVKPYAGRPTETTETDAADFLPIINFSKQETMFGLGTPEIIVLALVILLFFGGKRIPELMKGLGKGVRNFKDGMNNVTDIEKKDEDSKDKKTE